MSITKSFEHTKFNEIANTLLNKTVLVVKDKTYRLCEIEFYYKGKDHDDTYTHTINDQSEFGKFYFHKYKNGSYKSGTYKGVDLTFGDRETMLYCGVLIRSMMDVNTKEFIEGPCKCVNKILELFGFNDVKSFMDGKQSPLSIYNKEQQLYIMDSNLDKNDVFVGPRVGLSDKYPEWKMKDYRYATNIKLIKKQKKFVAVK